MLARWAAVAIENARLYEVSERRRHELEKAIRGLEATRDVAVAIGGEISLEHVLELIVKRGRALVGARSLVIMLREADELVVQVQRRARAGHPRGAPAGRRFDLRAGTRTRSPERITDVAARLRIAPREFGVPDAQTALLVPMVYRGHAVGSSPPLTTEQTGRVQRGRRADAAHCSRSVPRRPWRSRRACRPTGCAARWPPPTPSGAAGPGSCTTRRCRASAGCGCCSPRCSPRRTSTRRAARWRRRRSTSNVRSKTCGRSSPSYAPPRWMTSACTPRSRRCWTATASRAEPPSTASLTYPLAPQTTQDMDGEMQTTVYRLLQEALTNITKHARANTVRVLVRQNDGELSIEVQDDGQGFDTSAQSSGFGLLGMNERVALAGGTLSISSDANGTLLAARLPLRPSAPAGNLRCSAGRVVAHSAPAPRGSAPRACCGCARGVSRSCAARGAVCVRSRRSCSRARSA